MEGLRQWMEEEEGAGMPNEARLIRRGWVDKSHRGSSFAKHRLRRFLVSDGFHVQYFADETMRFRKGRFDLRNVLCLRASTDPDCAHGVDILLSESSDIPPRHTKTVVLDWGSAAVLELWLSLWTSAVALAHVDPLLHAHRDPQLASTFNVVRGGEPPLRTSVRLPGRPPLLSPRERRRTSCADLTGELTSAASMRPGDRTLTGHPSLRTLAPSPPSHQRASSAPPSALQGDASPCACALDFASPALRRASLSPVGARSAGGACCHGGGRSAPTESERRENDELDSPRSDLWQPRWRKSLDPSEPSLSAGSNAAAEPAARGSRRPRACARWPVTLSPGRIAPPSPSPLPPQCRPGAFPRRRPRWPTPPPSTM